MIQDLTHKKIVIGDNVSWVVNDNNIVIVCKKTKEQFIINYPEAAIWDLISRHSDLTMIIKKMRIITHKTSIKKVDALTKKTIQFWQVKKLIKAI